MIPIVKIAGINGQQYLPTEAGYQGENDSYFFSSITDSILRPLYPGLIVIPDPNNYEKAIQDIANVIRTAGDQGRKVAIRSGGHQYSGASSTGPDNILLDLSKTFQKEEDFLLADSTDPKHLGKRLRVSVSWDLGSFNDKLRENGLFVPHGQCQGVHLGGHVQSGGYGQLGRSFGLFSDHVTTIEIVDLHSPNNIKEVTKDNDSDLWYALLGGSPGNFGVITHFTIIPQEDKNHIGSHGLKSVHFYDSDKLHRFLDKMVEWSDKGDMSRNWDLCVSIVSQTGKPFTQNDKLNKFLMGLQVHETDDAQNILRWLFPVIVVYLQWTHFPGDPEFGQAEKDKFDFFENGSIPYGSQSGEYPVSTLSDWWILKAEREFDHPYVKRTYLTKSQSLGTDKWVDFITKRIDGAVVGWYGSALWNGLFICSQIQFFGGKDSMFYRNREGGESDVGTSFSWRDSTMVATVDCFHGQDFGAPQRASDFAHDTDKMIGPKGNNPKGRGCYSDEDRRVLWGSYETVDSEFDMQESWQYYYDSEAKWQKLGWAKKKYDPNDIFSPNDFRVYPPAGDAPTDKAAATKDAVPAKP